MAQVFNPSLVQDLHQQWLNSTVCLLKKPILVEAFGPSNSISIYPWLNIFVGTLILKKNSEALYNL